MLHGGLNRELRQECDQPAPSFPAVQHARDSRRLGKKYHYLIFNVRLGLCESDNIVRACNLYFSALQGNMIISLRHTWHICHSMGNNSTSIDFWIVPGTLGNANRILKIWLANDANWKLSRHNHRRPSRTSSPNFRRVRRLILASPSEPMLSSFLGMGINHVLWRQ